MTAAERDTTASTTTATLKAGFENMLHHDIPDVTEMRSV